MSYSHLLTTYKLKDIGAEEMAGKVYRVKECRKMQTPSVSATKEKERMNF
jgi:hypothetical protein